MPKYDYYCEPCDSTEEHTLGFYDDHEAVRCMFCSEKTRKRFAATPAVFKGLGWAKLTEYKPKGS